MNFIRDELKKVNKVYVSLFFAMLFSFCLLNYIALRGKNWFLNYSEAEVGIFAEHFYTTGSLKIPEIIIDDIDPEVFAPFGVGSVNGYYVPKVALGTLLLGVMGRFLGDQGPFFLFTIINLSGVIFLYKLLSEEFNKKIGLFSSVLYSLCFPFVFWSNFLYGNIPAFSFYIIGVYFLVRFTKEHKKFFYLLLFTCFFIFSIWVRYEYLLLAIISILISIVFRRKIVNLRNIVIVMSLGLVLFVLPFLLINKNLYGKAFTVGYVAQQGMVTEKSAKADTQSDSVLEQIGKIYKRFPLLRSPVKRMSISEGTTWIIDKFFYYGFRLFPFAGILTFACVFSIRNWKWKIKRYFWILFLGLCVSFIILFEASAFHAGWKNKQYDGFYSRYWAIYFAFSAMLSSLFLFQKLKKRIFIIPLIALSIVTSIVLSFSDSVFIDQYLEKKTVAYELYVWESQLPESSVIIANSLGRSFLRAPVLKPTNLENFVKRDPKLHVVAIDPDRDSYEELSRNIEILLDERYNVYLLESQSLDKEYYGMAGKLNDLNKAYSIDKLVIKDIELVDIYKISM